MNAYPVIKGVIVTLSCPDAIETLPCSKPMTNIFPDSRINNGTFHVINLQPWTKYTFSIRYIFNDSQSSECNATSITTLETSKLSEFPGTFSRNFLLCYISRSQKKKKKRQKKKKESVCISLVSFISLM